MTREGNFFEYKGISIPTKFKLTQEQDNALKEIIDHVINETTPITLSGYAGTGKTSVIRYLQKYMKKKFNRDMFSGFNFIYAAPTHAATVYLGLNLGFLPYTIQSIMVNMYNGKTRTFEKKLSSKFTSALDPYKNNVLIVDESSMLSRKDVEDLVRLMTAKKVNIVFMGDKAQIPEITKDKNKYVSDVFTKFKLVQLTEVKRTEDASILKILTEIRSNPTGVLPIIDNTETVTYYNAGQKAEFFEKFIELYKEEPENTVFVSYTNQSIQAFNKKVKEVLYEDIYGLHVGESIIGYGGYNNKNIVNGNLANSVKFQVTDVRFKDSFVFIAGYSKVLSMINEELSNMSTTYYPLSEKDSIVFKEITKEMYENNNRIISNLFKKIYNAKVNAIATNNWKNYYSRIDDLTSAFKSIDLGNTYIYVPANDRMELYSSHNPTHERVRKEFPELIIEKGIDYGYGITIHKSQGATYSNIFFNSLSTEVNTNPLMERNIQVGTEGNSLNYVGMSRASKKLFVLYGSKVKHLN
jgi:exodeoxyribonuclease-5